MSLIRIIYLEVQNFFLAFLVTHNISVLPIRPKLKAALLRTLVKEVTRSKFTTRTYKTLSIQFWLQFLK